MTARLTIEFEDGSSKVIELAKAVEIDLPAGRPQSIDLRQTNNGSWVMAFTKALFEGKKLKSLGVEKVR